MTQTLAIALLSAVTVSTVSLIGAATLFFDGDRLKKMMNLLLALAAGAMLGNALLHMVPHALEHAEHQPPAIIQQHNHVVPAGTDVHEHADDHDAHGGHGQDLHHDHDHDAGHETAATHDHDQAQPTPTEKHSHAHNFVAMFVVGIMLVGFFALYALDLTLLSLARNDAAGVKSLGYLVLVSDALENFMDGLVMGAAYLVSPAAGIAATVAIFLHEVPMELGDFAVLRHSGFSRRSALWLNFLSACVNLVGVALAVVLGTTVAGFTTYATPFAAGAILYIAASALLPQIRLQGNAKQKALHFAMTLLGVALMILILFLE